MFNTILDCNISTLDSYISSIVLKRKPILRLWLHIGLLNIFCKNSHRNFVNTVNSKLFRRFSEQYASPQLLMVYIKMF